MDEIWVAALNLISAAVGGLITFAMTRRKNRADAEGAIAGAAKDIVEAAAAQVRAIRESTARDLETITIRLDRAEQLLHDTQSDLRIVRARLRETEHTQMQTLTAIMSIATSASEQVAKLTVLRDNEREQLTREISRLRALGGMGITNGWPETDEQETDRRTAHTWTNPRQRFNGGA